MDLPSPPLGEITEVFSFCTLFTVCKYACLQTINFDSGIENPRVLVRFRVRAPLFKEPSLWLGFAFCIYKSLLQYSCFSLPWDRTICHARWRCAYRAYRFCRPDKAKPPSGIFSGVQSKTPHLTVRGSSYLMPGSSLLSHGETPHYHRRYGVSLLSSAWGQVGPPRYSRRKFLCSVLCLLG